MSEVPTDKFRNLTCSFDQKLVFHRFGAAEKPNRGDRAALIVKLSMLWENGFSVFQLVNTGGDLRPLVYAHQIDFFVHQ